MEDDGRKHAHQQRSTTSGGDMCGKYLIALVGVGVADPVVKGWLVNCDSNKKSRTSYVPIR